MKDTQSEKLLLELHPKLIESATTAYNEAVRVTPIGVHPVITQTLRTFEEQNRLYAQGRTAPGNIVTYAKAGQSMHNFGCALDFVITVGGKYIWKVDENWMTVVNIFKSHGFEAGIDWQGKKRDAPHFQCRFGFDWRQLLAKYNNKDFIVGTKYVMI